MSTSRTDLGVVIVSFNTFELLDACLASLASDVRESGLRADVWVVDNASADGTPERIARRHPEVRIEALDANLGFAGANNVVLRRWLEPGGDRPTWTLLLNPDTEVRPGAIAALVGALDADGRAGVAGPALVYPDGRFQHAAFRFPGVVQTVLDLLPVPRLMDSRLNGRYPGSAYATGTPFVVDFPLGACMLVRTVALDEVGLLDDGYFLYCEEVDWCRRLRCAGYHALCVPAATVVHHAGGSTRRAPGRMFGVLWHSRLRYFARYEPAWRRELLRLVVRLGLAARAAGDAVAVRSGRLTEAEHASRAAAYRAVFAEE